jgi:hypothetical protein
MGEDNDRRKENVDRVEQEETNGVVDVLDYATLLLSVIQDDIRHVQLRATRSITWNLRHRQGRYRAPREPPGAFRRRLARGFSVS